MDPLILSVLSALGAAVWSVWTWSEHQQKERQIKRDREAALYVNSFILAVAQMQSKLYKILEEDELAFYKREYPGHYEFASPAAIEVLHYMGVYFGWAVSIYRYGPYTRDSQMIALTRKIAEAWENRRRFPGVAFRFSMDDRAALGNAVLRRIGEDADALPVFEAVPLYQFEADINDSNSKHAASLYHSRAVQATVAAIDSADNAESLEGHERLAVLQNLLVDLLAYLESQEGFRVSFGERKKARVKGVQYAPTGRTGDEPLPVDAAIIHQIPGRIRVGVPRIKTDRDFADRLQSRLQSVENVQSVRMSTAAASVVISFSPEIPGSEFARAVLNAIRQGGSEAA